MPLPTPLLLLLPKGGRAAKPTDHDVKHLLLDQRTQIPYQSNVLRAQRPCPVPAGTSGSPLAPASLPRGRQALQVPGSCQAGCTVSPHSHQAHTCFLTQTSTDLGLRPNPRAWPLFLLEGRLASLSAVTSLSSPGEATSPKNAGLFNH